MSGTGTPPVIPSEFQQYNSYVVDPQWQRKFSIIWPSVLAFFVLLSLPHLVRSIRNGRAYSTFLGISEEVSWNGYLPAAHSDHGHLDPKRYRQPSVFRSGERFMGLLGSVFYWTLPGFGLNAGQIIIIAAYVVTVVLCIVLDAPLISNSNRAGFLALAQFPVVFLFATKNSVVSLLLGPGNGYEKLNFIHRWSGRVMFLGGLLHGTLWIRNHLEYSIPILGQQKETSGVACLALLCVIVLTSLQPVRRFCYEVFYIVHMLSFVAFFVTICYHTIYASPWIFPPLAFYGFDLLMRMFRHRIKDAILVPVDNQMTLIHVPYSTSGWIAGQHVRLRVFFSGRMFESHPLTIFSANPEISCIASASMPPGISFGVRACGDWSNALNRYAMQAAAEIRGGMYGGEKGVSLEEKEKAQDQGREGGEGEGRVEVPVQVMLDGPYGGCSVDLGEYETALLFAGGTGITFTLGLLDDIVGRCVRLGRRNGEVTKRIEFTWCVRSFGSIEWFAAALMDIANVAASSLASSHPLELHISIYVTCLCNPEAVPPIPNCDVTIIRPSVYRVLSDITAPRPNVNVKANSHAPAQASTSAPVPAAVSRGKEEIVEVYSNRGSDEVEVEVESGEGGLDLSSKLSCVEDGGGLVVCASGPQSLTREASNAVARLQMSGRGRRVGRVGFHSEVFTL